MKGQFMLISAVVIGLILLSTASTVSEIQNSNVDADRTAHDINMIKSEIEETNLSDSDERESLRTMIESLSGYQTQTKYWESQDCLNLTIKDSDSQYEVSCVDKRITELEAVILLELESLADFDSKGSYNKLSAEKPGETGRLSIGYRNGEPGDSLKGFWRMDNSEASYSITKSVYDNSYWNEGSDPDLNIHQITSDLEYESSSSTTVTINASNDGFGTWNTEVELYNYSRSSVSWNHENIGSSDGPIEATVPADIDNDGDTDVVYGSADENTVKFAENDGTGGGWTKTEVGSQDVESISVGDIDNDGDLDVVGAGNNDNIYFFENVDGDGSSWNRHDIGDNGATVRSIALGDINDNGRVDVVSTGYNDEVRLWSNDGTDSGWSMSTVGSGGRWTVATADIDGDSSLDIISGGNDGQVEFWDNSDGDGSSWSRNIIADESGRIFSLAVADIDEDGGLDVFASIANSDNDIKLYRNEDGDGSSWASSIIDSRSTSARTLQAADLNMDGRKDIVTGLNGDTDYRFEWHENDGSYSSWSGESLGDQGDAGHYGAAVADFNGDGVLDVVSGEDDSPAELRLWETQGISTNFIGSDSVQFTDSNRGSKEAVISWTPTEFSYNLVAEANPARNLTEVSETNDETAGSLNNRIIQQISASGLVQDYSGEENDGDSKNFDGDERGAEGVFSINSFSFEEEDDVVIVPDSPELGGMSELTISTWVYRTGAPGSNWAHIVSKSAESSGTGDADYAILQRDSGEAAFRINTDGVYSDTEASGNELTLNEWEHIVGVWDGSELKIYQNGVLQDTATESGDLNDAGDPLGIGRHANNMDDRYFTGNIDETRIYNEALSSSEVKELYFNGDTGDFRGSYVSTSKDIESGRSPSNLTVDSSIPGSTSAEITVKHSSGSEDTVTLDPGFKNYSLSIPDKGGSATAEINLSSPNTDATSIVDHMKLWASK